MPLLFRQAHLIWSTDQYCFGRVSFGAHAKKTVPALVIVELWRQCAFLEAIPYFSTDIQTATIAFLEAYTACYSFDFPTLSRARERKRIRSFVILH